LKKTTKTFSLRLRAQNYLAMEVLWNWNTQAENKTFMEDNTEKYSKLNLLLCQDRQCTYTVTLRRVRVTTVAVEKHYVLHILSVSVATVIQHAKRMRRIILSSVACPALPYFSTLSHKRHDSREKKVLNIICVFWFFLQLLCETFLSEKN
jgi:hypothetical protein